VTVHGVRQAPAVLIGKGLPRKYRTGGGLTLPPTRSPALCGGELRAGSHGVPTVALALVHIAGVANQKY